MKTEFIAGVSPTGPSHIVGASTELAEIVKLARRAAVGDAKVLITGESGVGKDLVANEIHRFSLRRKGPFIAVNCAGMTETLLESELFGHVRGSFTGAYRDKLGKLEQADGGTLFLDEVGEMSLRMQAMLLRFLEQGEVQRVGSARGTRHVDVRVVAATNRNLGERVAAGEFREDLLYRLRVIHIHVPALRDRRADVRPLIAHFASVRGRNARFSDDAVTLLERYRWPGNVRELQNVIEQAIWQAGGEEILPAHLPACVSAVDQLLQARERRRQIADDLYDALVTGGYCFWEHIHPLFLTRDITRHDIRELVRRGLQTTRGNYRGLLGLFRMPAGDYQRFHNFLTAHGCKVEFREFRSPDSAPVRRRRSRALLAERATDESVRPGRDARA
jgi:transcriptional regulator with PAS, ATPase and Fis domain